MMLLQRLMPQEVYHPDGVLDGAQMAPVVTCVVMLVLLLLRLGHGSRGWGTVTALS